MFYLKHFDEQFLKTEILFTSAPSIKNKKFHYNKENIKKIIK